MDRIEEQLEMLRATVCASDRDDDAVLMTSLNIANETSAVIDRTLESNLYSTLNYSYQPRQSVVPAVDLLAVVKSILMTRVVPVLCVIGIVGNIVTLVLLASHGLRRHLGRMEKFAASGMATLAAADAMFCLSVHLLTYGGGSGSDVFDAVSFRLIYSVYHNAIISTFIATSSWLTVTLALVRYVAVCHPLWARIFFGPTAAARFFVAAFLTSVVINVPRFFVYRVQRISCPDTDFIKYFQFYGWLRQNPQIELSYWWTYAVLGSLLPFCLLAFANVNLIRALRRASVARAAATSSPSYGVIDRKTSGGSRRSGSGEIGRHVTLTLVVVVALYLLLVTPAEVINVMRELFPSVGKGSRPVYNLCVAVVNTLQAANFSLNFLIYFIINAHFRRKIRRLSQTIWCCSARTRQARQQATFSTMADVTTTHQYPVIRLKTVASTTRLCDVTGKNPSSAARRQQAIAIELDGTDSV